MRFIIYSKALYSSWVYYSPDRLAFDAGEGISTILGNKVFAIEKIFLSHGHADHITGLIGLINIRNSGMGDTEKPLTIYYPKDNWRVLELISYIRKTNRRLKYRLEWVPLTIGDRVEVFSGQCSRYVEAFKVVHSDNEISLGYNIIEQRKRLKAEYRDLPQEEILKLVWAGKREEISETYLKKLVSYGGDSIALDPADVAGTDILLHDCTFLTEEERQDYKHATFSEALEVALRAQVQEALIALHISSRYKEQLHEIEERLGREHPTLPFKVIFVPPGKIFRYE
ncbi:MAG: MBL fold metallo-hydrolase [Candidatus Bipolaricaulota bacterium]|nr:MBL fold metallo-hydrolase [Candidatus Bipolaricaulota bacterium]MDW8031504.1 MBL fold metallo-hydrolase [Candidatus Bipolaricaulota bacterium]